MRVLTWVKSGTAAIHKKPPNCPTLYVTLDQKQHARIFLEKLKKIKLAKKWDSIRRVDVIFYLAQMLHAKHYPDSKIGMLKGKLMKLLSEDMELSASVETIVPKRAWDATDDD